MTAVTVETMKTIAVVAIAVLVLMAVVVARITASITRKVIGFVVLAALAGALWSQRASLADCADTIAETAEDWPASGELPDGASCTFFGYEVEVSVPGT